MEPHNPETAQELEDLSASNASNATNAGGSGGDKVGAGATISPGSSASTVNVQHEKPKVRFNSDGNLPAAAAYVHGEQRTSLGTRKLRPALSRNPNSSDSVSCDMADELLSPEKAASAAAAAQRARAVAMDARDHSNDSSQRWSMETETVTDAGYVEVPMASADPSLHVHDVAPSGGQGAKVAAEAEELLKAHTQDLLSAQRENPDDVHVSTGNARGGVFYQLLQAYRNPTYDGHQDQRPTKWDTPGSSGGATPTRRKWYEQDKETRSQETLARLVGASAKLANPNEKMFTPPQGSEVRKRPGHKRTTSGKIMSMMGMTRENEARITIHVADILKRQKYLIKMCRALMLFGAPTHRLEEYLATSAKVLEIDSQFLYIPGCMVISFDDVLTHTTEVRIVRTAQGVNLGKLKDVHEIYKEVLHDVISLDDALSRLDQVINAKNRFPVWVTVLMYGLASATVSTFFQARFIDMPIIFVMGALLGFLQLVVAPRSKTYNTVFEVSAAILLSFLSRAFASIRHGNLFCFSALTQGSIAMILPGWLVLSSALELQSKAIVPGSIRLVYAIIYSLFLAYGITVGTALYGAIDSTVTSTTCQNPPSHYWRFLFVPLYVFFTTFTVQAKWSQMPVMVAIALAGYTVNFFTSAKFAASPSIAYTFGAFTVGVLANLYSRLRHGVAAAVLLPAVYVQVPGSLASTGAITSGLKVASDLANSTQSNDTQLQLNSVVFNVAASMIQIAIGITVGLLMSALIVYPMGKRRSGLWTL
ncbi:hypothetical protein F5Y19DRAFT_176178 [Xylariaceae sp. FL1651]|nr:hypothetical protein F5Y19DRAFT_176178 [Xylariaceae sp. FL1651]